MKKRVRALSFFLLVTATADFSRRTRVFAKGSTLSHGPWVECSPGAISFALASSEKTQRTYSIITMLISSGLLPPQYELCEQ